VTPIHISQAKDDALQRIARQSRIVFSADAFRLVSVEHPQIDYLNPAQSIPRGFGTFEQYRHPNDPRRMTAWAIWICNLTNGEVELRVRVAVDLTAEQYSVDEWSKSDGFALEWACEQRTLVKTTADLYAGIGVAR
jgi:hypothetical protein